MVCVLEVRICPTKIDSFCQKLLYYFHFHIEARGNISHNSSGALVAMLDQAQQLNPDANPPVVALETDKKYLNFTIETQLNRNIYRIFHFSVCLIHKHGLTGVIVLEKK